MNQNKNQAFPFSGPFGGRLNSRQPQEKSVDACRLAPNSTALLRNNIAHSI